MRIGSGFDVHRFDAGGKLYLGGVLIPFENGLIGHSDADVVIHAVIDALLGSIAAADIGAHFPDTDPEFKDISSIELLKKTKKIIEDEGFFIENIDITAILEEPKIANYRQEMRENIAGTLCIEVERVSVKATTTEGLGFTGRGEGVAAQCVALVDEKNPSKREVVV